MLTLRFEKQAFFDEEKNEFIDNAELEIKLEHSLASVSKWESIFEKPFLTEEEKSHEETLSYIKCMNLDEDFSEEIDHRLTEDHLKKINDYITAKMTATWFREAPNKPRSREIITAEVIYYWMISLNIPIECQHWHLNKLFTLIKVVNEKTQQAQNGNKKKPMSRSDLDQRRALNQARKAQMGTTG